MRWPDACLVILPCNNEASTIGFVVEGVRAFLPNVLVVDDGSRDATAMQATKAGAEVLGHGKNCGKGAALRSGWEWAAKRNYTWVLFMDGDGQHLPTDIPALLAAGESTGATLVIGNRMQNPENMPWLRRRVNRWMSKRLSGLCNQPVPDSQCGFRLVRLDILQRLAPCTDRFEIESEVLVAFARAGERIAFVPVHSRYQGEQSKIRPLHDSWRWLRWWLRMWLGR